MPSNRYFSRHHFPPAGDFNIQPALVEQPEGLLAGLSITDRGIGQGNGGNSSRRRLFCPKYCPHLLPDVNGSCYPFLDGKPKEKPLVTVQRSHASLAI
jgi:hypothetical protein